MSDGGDENIILELLKATQKAFSQVAKIAYENSILLNPSTLQKILLIRIRSNKIFIIDKTAKNQKEKQDIVFKSAEELWMEAKKVINEMRQEIDLPPYPLDDYLLDRPLKVKSITGD